MNPKEKFEGKDDIRLAIEAVKATKEQFKVKIIADVLGVEIATVNSKEGAAYGAALYLLLSASGAG